MTEYDHDVMMTDDWNDNDNSHDDDNDDNHENWLWTLNMIIMTDDRNDNDDDDHLIDGDDDQKDGDYPARQTPPVRLHGKSRVPTASAAKNKKPIQFTRPKKSVPTAERSHKYSLRENPTPSKKYQ